MLPVIQTVVNTIGQVIRAAPVIAGLVGHRDGHFHPGPLCSRSSSTASARSCRLVLSFIGSKDGMIQEIISTVMPVVVDILTTARRSFPVIDIKSVCLKSFSMWCKRSLMAQAKSVSSVWDKVKPVVEGIGNGLSWIADKVGGLWVSEVVAEATQAQCGRHQQLARVAPPGWVSKGRERSTHPVGQWILPNKESAAGQQLAEDAGSYSSAECHPCPG